MRRGGRCVQPVSYTHLDVYKRQGEECTEVIIGAMKGSREETIYEISDLCYHVLVQNFLQLLSKGQLHRLVRRILLLKRLMTYLFFVTGCRYGEDCPRQMHRQNWNA